MEHLKPKRIRFPDVKPIYRDYSIHGNLEDVCNRVGTLITDLLEENEGINGNILCVSHGIAILAALYTADKDVYEECLKNEVRFKNCSVTIIGCHQGSYTVECVNATEYITKGGYYEEDYQ